MLPGKPRILCLHGDGSNSSVSQAQLRNLGFTECFRVTHLVAPCLREGEIDKRIGSLSAEEGFHSWVGKEKDTEERLSELVASLRFVLGHVIREGPYDAVYGFSHGAGIAAMLSCDAIRRELVKGTENVRVDEESGVNAPWNFVFAACATLPAPWEDVSRYLLKADTCGPVSIPSVHFIAMEDPRKRESESLFDKFGDDGSKLPVYFRGGHEIASGSSSLKQASRAAIEWFSSFDSGFSLPTIGRDPPATLCGITKKINNFAAGISSQETAAADFAQHQLMIAAAATEDYDEDLNLVQLMQNRDIEDRVAFRAPGMAPITYGTLRKFVRDEGNLSNIGCEPGDKVAYLVPFGILGAVSFIAIASQCTAVPLDPEISPEDLDSAFRQLRPDAFIGFDDLGIDVCARAKGVATRLGIRVFDASGRTQKAPFVFTNSNRSNLTNNGVLETRGRDTCLLLRTSGTTSEPKVVPLKMSSVVTNAFAIANNLGLRKDDVALNAMPLFHIGGLMTNLLAAFVSGGSSIFLPKFNVSTFVTALTSRDDIQPTWFSAVPTILAAVESVISSEESFQSSLRFIRVGAAAMSDHLIKKCQQTLGCRVVPTYSMSECMPISQPPTGSTIVDERHGSVGHALNVSICIVDSNLVPLPNKNKTDDAQVPFGEVCISGQCVMNGYVSNDEANRNAFFRIGQMTWFRTGDLGYLDEDKFLHLTGRSKDMIKIHGDQVSPIEVEDMCMKFPNMKICVAFSQPSDDEWGEQVGIACVLLNDKGSLANDEIQFSTKLRIFLKKQGLANWKIPKRIEIVREEDLPKTKTGKHIRAGLAEILNETHPYPKLIEQQQRAKSPVHPAAAGVQFVLAVAVMYVHIGNLNVWHTDPSFQGSGTFERSDKTGNFASEWSNTRTWCFHTPLFFFVGGFLLAAGTNSPISGGKGLLNFYRVRILSLHPMYLLSLVLCTVIFVFRCNPGNYSSEFDRTLEPSDGENFVCQAAPVEMNWVSTLLMSIMSYSLLLQAWPVALPLTWFLSYYTWFSSVYIFCVIVFPWCHKPFYAAKENRRTLWKLTLKWLVALYFFVGAFSLGLNLMDDEVTLNWFALTMYLFPPGWLPCFSIGIGTFFLIEDYRKGGNIKLHSWKWGVLTDVLSALLLAGWLFYGIAHSLATPSLIETSELGHRYWAAYVSRLVCPVGFLWFCSLAVGEGGTAWLFSRKTIVDWLAPCSYNVFLFHQPIAELYFFATRRMWWAYPKTFYWFSPHPIPVDAWEIPIVMLIVVLFSMVMHFYVNYLAIAACASCMHSCFQRQKQTAQPGMPIANLVRHVIARVTHIDESFLTNETDLTEIGLTSMMLPVAISEINLALKKNNSEVSLTSRSVLGARSVNDLVSLATSTREDGTLDQSLRKSKTFIDPRAETDKTYPQDSLFF